ncbi:hypothetical protein DIC66_16735 [Rhodoferax lacus]|uniref:DUF802 domain-containing protein n=1 Tax=Rhodoferax lacus TaxID=2184758 RepID=A0A3E1R9E0_9BURK|nr:hypothetical protein [Rhodoferax lacus]RFO95831.1 hypothetical protein DIC66_16735 [Rhodoferax lacus]
MNKHLFTGLFLLGAAALLWVGAGFVAGHTLALVVTLVIAAVYCFGARELYRFRQATQSLSQALAHIPDGLAELGGWLGAVHASLQTPVRLRIEGERISLPGPALTPYLVGLLVMLGMLGTFLGMMVTLNGAVFALEGTADLAAIRAAFATPIKGLGLAFGTSVAGVASSAVLGLLSALSRRERLQAAQLLDQKIATQLRGFSLTHQRQEAYQALQLQSQSLPLVVDKLQALMEQMGSMQQQLNERLLGNQERFHSETQAAYTGLASAVDQSLRQSMAQSAQAVGESIKPVVEAAMAGMALESRNLQTGLVDSTQQQLEALSARLAANSSTAAETLQHNLTQAQAEQAQADQQRLAAWTTSLQGMADNLQQSWQHSGEQTLARQQQICATLEQTAAQVGTTLQQTVQQLGEHSQTHATQTLAAISGLLGSSEELVRTRIQSEAEWSQAQGERMDQMATLLQRELGALREQEAQRGLAAVERLGELQTALTGHLSTLGMALEAPIARLIETASEAPRAAAEVIGKLRQEVNHSVARDNELLEERGRILETLNTLMASMNHAAHEQRAVIDTLVASSAAALSQAGSAFGQQVETEAAKLSDIAAQVTSGAVEVSSLGEAFGLAVGSFGEANAKLIAGLQRIEGALDKSMARSDEQLAYYVAQAREVIDLSIMSQKDIVQELRQLASQQAALNEEAA